MSLGAQTMALPATSEVRTGRPGWIESPWFDTAFFILSPVLILPIAYLFLFVDVRFVALILLLEAPHYFSTFSFYFWDEYRDRHRERWLAFLGGPVLIAVSLIVLVAMGLPRIIQIAVFLWNTYHVALQNCGILSIYRHRAGVNSKRDKNSANLAILATAFWLAFWNISTHPSFDPLFALSPDYPRYLRIGLGVIAAVALVRLALTLLQRVRSGKLMSSGELLFLLISVTMFHPYLWVRSSVAATAVMLLPHYVQYLGLVWLLHRRRFRKPSGSPAQQVLHRVSASIPLLLGVLISIGAVIVSLVYVGGRLWDVRIFQIVYLLVALEHFYLDGMFWAFRDPSVRKSLGPYLTGHVPAPAAK